MRKYQIKKLEDEKHFEPRSEENYAKHKKSTAQQIESCVFPRSRSIQA